MPALLFICRCLSSSQRLTKTTPIEALDPRLKPFIARRLFKGLKAHLSLRAQTDLLRLNAPNLVRIANVYTRISSSELPKNLYPLHKKCGIAPTPVIFTGLAEYLHLNPQVEQA